MAPIPESFDLVPLTRDRLPDVLELDMWAFPTGDSLEDMLAVPSPLSWDRTFGVVESDHPERLVALHSSYPFANCPVPGGRVRAAGLTWVGVHPQWRRRGLLSAMMDTHFAHCRGSEEPVSLLTASEPAIYGRFGYGLATRRLHLTMKRGAALRPVSGSQDVSVRFETASLQHHGELVGRLHAAVDRPGWVTRETKQLAAVWLSDAPVYRAGREVQRIAVAERAGEAVGYALFRRKSNWAEGGPEGTVGVQEVVAADPAVAHALWSRLLDLDLMTEVTSGLLADDDPLLSLLVDLRAARVSVKDNVWVRIIDVPVALGIRQYQARLDVVLEVSDARLPHNAARWRLTAEAFGSALVEATDADADLALDVRELGAAYLGGTSLLELAGAGLVTELRAGALREASVAFGWPVAPGSSWIF